MSAIAWIVVMMDFSPDNESNWNTEVLKFSPMWPYCGNSTEIFKCPADKSTIKPSSGPYKGKVVPRILSMSMNYWLGGVGGANNWGVSGSGWKVYLTLGDIVDPGPTRTFVFLDMREDSIDRGPRQLRHGYDRLAGQARTAPLRGSSGRVSQPGLWLFFR